MDVLTVSFLRNIILNVNVHRMHIALFSLPYCVFRYGDIFQRKPTGGSLLPHKSEDSAVTILQHLFTASELNLCITSRQFLHFTAASAVCRI